MQGQNFAPKTLRAYGDDLTQFLSFVEKNRVDWDSPTRFDRADIEGFMQYLAAQRRSGVTRIRKLAAIRICWKERDIWHTTCFKAGMHRRREPA